LRRCKLRSLKTLLDEGLNVFEESIFAIASFLQLTSQFFLATFHILAKIF
jgi:hypothetical protein